MENDNKEGAYEIGYGKPPRHRRFQKGQSGNFRGRPKGAKNFTTVAEEALANPSRSMRTGDGRPRPRWR